MINLTTAVKEVYLKEFIRVLIRKFIVEGQSATSSIIFNLAALEKQYFFTLELMKISANDMAITYSIKDFRTPQKTLLTVAYEVEMLDKGDGKIYMGTYTGPFVEVNKSYVDYDMETMLILKHFCVRLSRVDRLRKAIEVAANKYIRMIN